MLNKLPSINKNNDFNIVYHVQKLYRIQRQGTAGMSNSKPMDQILATGCLNPAHGAGLGISKDQSAVPLLPKTDRLHSLPAALCWPKMGYAGAWGGPFLAARVLQKAMEGENEVWRGAHSPSCPILAGKVLEASVPSHPATR